MVIKMLLYALIRVNTMIVYFSPVPYSTNALFSPPRVISSLKVHVPIVKQKAFSIFWKFLFHPDDVNTGRIIN